MGAVEIVSIVTSVFSCIGVISALVFSSKKANKEAEKDRKEAYQENQQMRSDISAIKIRVEKIDDRTFRDHEININHEARIKNLEKSVFKKGA